MALTSDTKQRLAIACASQAAADEIEAKALDVTTQAAVADLTVAYTAGNPNIVPNGTVTIANGATPTVAELLEAVEELKAKLNTTLARLRAAGIIA